MMNIVNAKLDGLEISVSGRGRNTKEKFFTKYFPEIEDCMDESWVVVFPKMPEGQKNFFMKYSWAKEDENADTVYAVRIEEQSLIPFDRWWYEEGSGMPPKDDEDIETFAKRIAEIAWDNGAHKERYRYA